MPKMDREKRRPEKKVSWMYRNKKRVSWNKREEGSQDEDAGNVQIQNRKARIVVRNLPFKVTEDDIKKHYEPYGEIEEINLLRHPGGKLVGCGFVQFKRVEQASKAIFNTNKKELLGRVISSDWAIPKYKFSEQGNIVPNEHNADHREQYSEGTTAAGTDAVGMETIGTNEENSESPQRHTKSGKRKKNRKDNKIQNQKKRARIIVRNLSFKTTEDSLKEHFSQFGDIEEVKVLTRPDGKLVGCGFVQYNLVQDAAKAIHHSNLKPLLGRPVIVDWAVPKNKFGKVNGTEGVGETRVEEIEIKTEKESDNDEESHDSSKDQDVTIKEETKEEMDGEDSDEDSSESEDEDEVKEVKDERVKSEDGSDNDPIEDEEEPHPRRISNDIGEGKTVFLKNVPFSVKNEDLKQCMEQFGPVYYALVCMDHLTEHSKGTAFVKFRNVEDAEKCLSAGTELRLHDQVLDPHRALNRNDVQDKKSLKEQKVKDSRNLYLVKEGVILAGSPAAVGLSAGDMARRLQLEQWKSQMLRNLNMFVSRVRLVVHNLPESVDDIKLRELFKNHSRPKAMIREARVMRDLRNVESNGIGKSKEYGFVTFSIHEDALQALRSINNNPNIFGKTKRPIVAFSIENRVMVNAKQKRIEKSRERNPLYSGDKRKGDDVSLAKRARIEKPGDDDNPQPYSGVASKPGEKSKMRSKFNLKTQAKMHNQTLKQEKKKTKSDKKRQMKRREEAISRKQIKSKQGVKRRSQDEVDFSKMVNNYKCKLMETPQTRTKWYEA